MSAEVNAAPMGNDGRDREAPQAPHAVALMAHAGIRDTLAPARRQVATAVNTAMVQAYWEVGRRIVEAQGDRAEYGKRFLRYPAGRLAAESGPGFDESDLRNRRRLCSPFPTRYALRPESSWTHYRDFIRDADPHQRAFNDRIAAVPGWTARPRHRQVATLGDEGLLGTRNDLRDEVPAEVLEREPSTVRLELEHFDQEGDR